MIMPPGGFAEATFAAGHRVSPGNSWRMKQGRDGDDGT
jgi:hypothetical protein